MGEEVLQSSLEDCRIGDRNGFFTDHEFAAFRRSVDADFDARNAEGAIREDGKFAFRMMFDLIGGGGEASPTARRGAATATTAATNPRRTVFKAITSPAFGSLVAIALRT